MDEIIIYGAGNMGQAVVELLRDRCNIRCFLDGNPKLKGTFIQNIPVCHPSDAADHWELLKMDVLIAMTACPFSVMRRVLMDAGFLRIFPAGDYVAERYTGCTILNTWKCEETAVVPGFSDEKSVHDYQAAGAWFTDRADQESILTKNKYFPDFLWEKITDCKVMLDTAVLDGGYIDTFLQSVPGAAAYAFTLTPPSAAAKDLRNHFSGRTVELFSEEASDRDGMIDCQRIGLMRPFTQAKPYRVRTTKIDTIMSKAPFGYLRCYSMSRVLPILKGGEGSIQQYRPVIAVNIGHYRSDFLEVPEYLRTVCKDYDFYFRMHSYQANDCILYAVPRDHSIAVFVPMHRQP